MIENIVIVNDYNYVDGGASMVAIRTAIELSKLSQFNVFFFGGCGEPCEELVNSNVNIVSLKLFDLIGNPSKINAIFNGIYNKKVEHAFKTLLAGLDKEKTVVHIHTWTKVLTSSVFYVAQKMKYRVCVTLHDYFLTCPNGGCYNYVANHICRLKPMSMKCICCNCDVRSYPQKIWRVIRQGVQNRKINKNNLTYIFISEFQRTQFISRYGDVKKQILINNPIDVKNRFRIEAEENQYFTYIGRLSEEKGVELFCEAVQQEKVSAVVIGDGKLKNELEKKYPNITFTGWLDKEQISVWLEKTRCLIFPSKWFEGAPLTPLEVLAFGIPCITSNCNAALDYIKEDMNGRIFVSESVDSLVSEMRFFKSNEYTREISERAFHEYNEDLYSCDKYIKRMIELYKKIETEKEKS